jgi:hypothetical protein
MDAQPALLTRWLGHCPRGLGQNLSHLAFEAPMMAPRALLEGGDDGGIQIADVNRVHGQLIAK